MTSWAYGAYTSGPSWHTFGNGYNFFRKNATDVWMKKVNEKNEALTY